MGKNRKRISTTLDKKLYKKIQLLAVKKDKNVNDFLEEGMRYILKQYRKKKK